MTEFRLHPPSSDIGKYGLSYHATVPQAIQCRFGKEKKKKKNQQNVCLWLSEKLEKIVIVNKI